MKTAKRKGGACLRVADLARTFNLAEWTVRRLLDVGVIPGATRFARGMWRIDPAAMPEIRAALKDAGYVK